MHSMKSEQLVSDGLGNSGPVTIYLNIYIKDYRAVVRTHYIAADDNITHLGHEPVRDDKIVDSPPYVSFARLHPE